MDSATRREIYSNCDTTRRMNNKMDNIISDVTTLSTNVERQQNNIKNISDKVDNLTDKLNVLIDALTLIDQKVSEKKMK